MWYKAMRQKLIFVFVVVLVLITTKPFYWKPSSRLKKSARNIQHSNGYSEPSRPHSDKETIDKTPSSLNEKPRMRNLEKVCKRQKHSSWSSLTFKQKQILSHHVIVNDQLGFLFCYVPKVACSNWKRVMMALERRVTDPNDVDKYDHREFTFLEDFPPRGIQRRIDSYFKFMFVRDPLDRLVSAYNDKFVKRNITYFHERYGKQIALKYRKSSKKQYKDDVTFNEFFRYLSDTKVEQLNEHWAPFYELCQPCAMRYDFIGSFEKLEEDANKVLRHLNSSQPVRFPRMQQYYKPFDKKARNDLLSTVPYNILKKVLEKYALDYKLFSFPFPTDRLRKSRLKSKKAKKKRHAEYANIDSYSTSDGR